MSVVNTLAYYTKETLTAVKKIYSTGLLGEQKMTAFWGQASWGKIMSPWVKLTVLVVTRPKRKQS